MMVGYMEEKKIQLLDCTLRDGGQGLEAAYQNGVSKSKFEDNMVSEITSNLSFAHVDIVEIGFIERKNNLTEFASYYDIETISRGMPKNRELGQKFSALYTGPDTPLNVIPNWNSKLVDSVRVILRYSELKKSLDFCQSLSDKGYNVFVQPMLTMRYTDTELDYVIERVNEMKAYSLYFVDSYGYMNENDVKRFFDYFDSRLNEDIKIVFHAHNNLNLAYSNALKFLELVKESDRCVIVDSCALGMGQGAGNLQTEIIVPYLNENYSKNYVLSKVLDVCESIEMLSYVPQWGYSLTYSLPAIYKTAYKYAMIMRLRLGFSYNKINHILQNMEDFERQRYTKKTLVLLLKRLDYLEDSDKLLLLNI